MWRPPSACLPSSDPCQTLRTEAPQECSSSHCSRSRSGTLFPTLTTALSVCYNRKWKNATVFLTMRNGVDLSKFVQSQFSSHIPYFSGHTPVFFFTDARDSAYPPYRLIVVPKLKNQTVKSQIHCFYPSFIMRGCFFFIHLNYCSIVVSLIIFVNM